jgi:hypothetical protein
MAIFFLMPISITMTTLHRQCHQYRNNRPIPTALRRTDVLDVWNGLKWSDNLCDCYIVRGAPGGLQPQQTLESCILILEKSDIGVCSLWSLVAWLRVQSDALCITVGWDTLAARLIVQSDALCITVGWKALAARLIVQSDALCIKVWKKNLEWELDGIAKNVCLSWWRAYWRKEW